MVQPSDRIYVYIYIYIQSSIGTQFQPIKKKRKENRKKEKKLQAHNLKVNKLIFFLNIYFLYLIIIETEKFVGKRKGLWRVEIFKEIKED